jgi:hypothetical protein
MSQNCSKTEKISPYTFTNEEHCLDYRVLSFAGYEVLTVVKMISAVFWDAMPCSLQYIQGIYYLSLPGQRVSQGSTYEEAGSSYVN